MLVDIPKTRLFEQPFSARSNYPQTAKDFGNARWSTFERRETTLGHKRVSGVQSGGHWVSMGGSWLEHGLNFPNSKRFSLSSSVFSVFKISSKADNPNLIDEEQVKKLSSSPNNCSFREINAPSCVDEKLFFRTKSWERSRSSLQKFVWIPFKIITVYAF